VNIMALNMRIFRRSRSGIWLPVSSDLVAGTRLGEVEVMTEEKLEYFKRKLSEKGERLAVMAQRSEELARESDSEPQDTADSAVASYTKEFMFGQSSAEHQVLLSIREALDAIEDRSYGLCDSCGGEIEHRRLEAVPWARRCIACQSRLERALARRMSRTGAA
jgi:DnaK suppressor protein